MKITKKIMNTMFLSCTKASELIDKKIYFKLTLKESIQLKLHKSMCEACTKYDIQSQLIDKKMTSMIGQKNNMLNSNELKDRILSKLDGNR